MTRARRARRLRWLRVGGAVAAILAGATAAAAQTFSYLPPGDLIAGSGQGRVDWTVYAPGIRFPVELAPTYVNSQVYMVGGSQGPAGSQCDPANYSYPWRDNYCENRSWTMPLCPAGIGHQGEDMRPPTCDNHTYWCVATTDGTITNVGNYSVYLTAPDGTRYDYLHMSTVQVSVGQPVSRGQRLGLVSNQFNGTPTSIHLHFNIRQYLDNVGTVYVPPYMSLIQAYETLIGPICQCTAGDVDDESCGNCGLRTRTCGSNCLWGAWSSCQGEGPCSAGAVQTEDCCDCGERSRVCDQGCEWTAWSPCAGPHPPGQPPCTTGEPGPCASGTVRCVDGCLQCTSDYTPTAEICDGVDNDCSGVIDDGFPAQLGVPAPELAARLVDFSHPAWLAPNERGSAWAVFANEGSRRWEKRTLWLESSTARTGEPSELWDSEGWPAWDVAAVLDESVEPGASATLRWTVRAPAERGMVAEQFRIAASDGVAVACPEPRVPVALRVGAGEPEAEAAQAGSAPALDAGGGCRTVVGERRRSRGISWGWVAFVAVGAVLARRRSAYRDARSCAAQRRR